MQLYLGWGGGQGTLQASGRETVLVLCVVVVVVGGGREADEVGLAVERRPELYGHPPPSCILAPAPSTPTLDGEAMDLNSTRLADAVRPVNCLLLHCIQASKLPCGAQP